MGNSKTAPSSWMLIDGTGKTEVFGGPEGWKVVRPDGTIELLQCMGGVAEAVANAAGISLVVNPVSKAYALGSNIEFKVTWDEPVNINVAGGVPSISFKIGAANKTAVLIGGSKTGVTKSTFRFVADAALGSLNTVVTSIALNSGTIFSGDDGVTAAVLTFPADYSQPTGVSVV